MQTSCLPIFFKVFCRFFVSFFILLLFNNCKHDKLDVDTSGIKTDDVKLMRLEKRMFSITPENEKEVNLELEKSYGVFYKRFQALQSTVLQDN